MEKYGFHSPFDETEPDCFKTLLQNLPMFQIND